MCVWVKHRHRHMPMCTCAVLCFWVFASVLTLCPFHEELYTSFTWDSNVYCLGEKAISEYSPCFSNYIPFSLSPPPFLFVCCWVFLIIWGELSDAGNHPPLWSPGWGCSWSNNTGGASRDKLPVLNLKTCLFLGEIYRSHDTLMQNF